MNRRAPWIALILLAPGSAHATYSIAAVDTAARQVGGAGTSCIAPFSVAIIYGSAPGHGVVHAQALLNTLARDEATSRLELDEAPADIIAAITSPSFDADASQRQYGIVDLMGRSAGFTGADTMPYAEEGAIDTFVYSVQGNILTGVAVIDQAEEAFAKGCDLGDRLMRALEAGADNAEGDSRCTPSGIPSDAAFLAVDREGEGSGDYLFLQVADTAPESPVVLLRQAYDAWRDEHPCPEPPTEPAPDLGPSDGGATEPPGDDTGGCGCRLARPAPRDALAASLLVLAGLAILQLGTRRSYSPRLRGRGRP